MPTYIHICTHTNIHSICVYICMYVQATYMLHHQQMFTMTITLISAKGKVRMVKLMLKSLLVHFKMFESNLFWVCITTIYIY